MDSSRLSPKSTSRQAESFNLTLLAEGFVECTHAYSFGKNEPALVERRLLGRPTANCGPQEQRLRASLEEKIWRHGLIGIRVSADDGWQHLDREQRCAAINAIDDVLKKTADGCPLPGGHATFVGVAM